jgi:crossover junction endodeoxyribonuclease RuvC
MRVLGLDPGTERTGWGCIESGPQGPRRVASGVVALGRGPLPQRLAKLHLELGRLFDTYAPESCATEGVFSRINPRSALLLGHARGVCLLVAGLHDIAVAEYAPATVKRSVAGHGAADKRRVGAWVAGVLGFEAPATFDESDALAVALCHLEAQRPLRLIG